MSAWCVVCGGPGLNRLCAEHQREWQSAKERDRWCEWIALGFVNRADAAFRDFATTRQAERRNALATSPLPGPRSSNGDGKAASTIDSGAVSEVAK